MPTFASGAPWPLHASRSRDRPFRDFCVALRATGVRVVPRDTEHAEHGLRSGGQATEVRVRTTSARLTGRRVGAPERVNDVGGVPSLGAHEQGPGDQPRHMHTYRDAYFA